MLLAQTGNLQDLHDNLLYSLQQCHPACVTVLRYAVFAGSILEAR
jgi:hypothetical protein